MVLKMVYIAYPEVGQMDGFLWDYNRLSTRNEL